MTGHPHSVPSLHDQVLERLGLEICTGQRQAGSVLTLNELERTHGVSRSVGREAVRVLESMRLVVSRRRVGIVVRPAEEWNLFEPQVIRWRMQSPQRTEQLEALIGLRLAVEPEAARLTALRASAGQAAELVALAARMWAAGEEGDLEAFHNLDVQFHVLMLECSGNPLFVQLQALVSGFLEGWHAGLGPGHPLPVALQLHAQVATAIQRREPEEAFTAMRALLTRSADDAS